ncbi:MAG: 4a-hydroxytetrahydrobiopterin dehydratase [Chloroflexota bacterium]
MTKAQALSEQELSSALQTIDGWSVVDGKLHRTLTFDNFVQAFGFMTQIALVAEVMDHHPEWYNVYNRVTIDLITHSADNTITTLDIKLAHKIDQIDQATLRLSS